MLFFLGRMQLSVSGIAEVAWPLKEPINEDQVIRLTLRGVLQVAYILLTVLQVVCKSRCFLEHGAVPGITCGHESLFI